MKGILFKPDVWKGKQQALEKYSVAVTRRLDGLKEVNKEPDKWIYYGWSKEWSGYCFNNQVNRIEVNIVKPRYNISETVYVKEAWAINGCGKLVPLDSETWNGNFPKERVLYLSDFPKDKYIWNKRSPLFMPECAARTFLKIKDVKPEKLNTSKLTGRELELEGGKPALDILAGYDGKWVWRIEFELMKGEKC